MKQLYVLEPPRLGDARTDADIFAATREAGNDSYHRFYLDPLGDDAKTFPNLYRWVLSELFLADATVPENYVLFHIEW